MKSEKVVLYLLTSIVIDPGNGALKTRIVRITSTRRLGR